VKIIRTVLCCVVYRVRTDPRKVCEVLEFNVEIFKALKVIIGMEKSGKIHENCHADLVKANVNYTVDYT